MVTVNRQKSLLITSETIGNHVNVLVAGELNSGTSPKLEKTVNEIIEQGYHKLVFSLENVSLITSAGLRVLLVIAKELRKLGGNIALYDSKPNVIEIFRMTGFDTILELSDSYEDAVLAVGSTVVAFGRDEEGAEATRQVFH